MPYNATATTTEEFLPVRPTGIVVFDKQMQRVLIVLSYWVISVSGLAGNGLVIYAVIRFRRLRTVTNVFVVNLAVSDFVGCSLLPLAGLDHPKDICQVIIRVIHVIFGASVVNIVLIAVNRYVLMIHSKVRYLRLYKNRNVILMILITWIYATLMVCAPPIFEEGVLHSREYRICGNDTKLQWNSHHTAIRFILGLLPCLVIAILCYVAIFWFVCQTGRNRRKLFRGSNLIAVGKRPIDTLQLIVTKNLAITVCAYITLISPYVLVYSISGLESLRLWAALCLTANSCVNPIIYGYGHPHFKDAFHAIFMCNSVKETLTPVLLWRRGRLTPHKRPSADQTARSPAHKTVDMLAL